MAQWHSCEKQCHKWRHKTHYSHIQFLLRKWEEKQRLIAKIFVFYFHQFADFVFPQNSYRYITLARQRLWRKEAAHFWHTQKNPWLNHFNQADTTKRLQLYKNCMCEGKLVQRAYPAVEEVAWKAAVHFICVLSVPSATLKIQEVLSLMEVWIPRQTLWNTISAGFAHTILWNITF